MKRVNWISVSVVAALLCTSALADDGGRRGGNGNNGNNGGNAGNGNNGNTGNNGQNNQNSFSSSLIGSMPGAMAGGVSAAGAPWVVSQGSASVSSNGMLEVNVTGLLLGVSAPANLVGTVGPVQMVAASLICGGSGGTVVANTAAVYLNASGNARIESEIPLPLSCIAPAVVVRIVNPAAAAGSQLGAFIATTGITAGSNGFPVNGDHRDN